MNDFTQSTAGGFSTRPALPTWLLQMFGVFEPTEDTSILRSIVTFSLADLLSLELSGPAVLGEGPDALERFADRDLAHIRVRRAFQSIGLTDRRWSHQQSQRSSAT